VNSLGEELMKEFEELYTKFSGDPAAQAAVLISGKPGCFIAGADIKVHMIYILNQMQPRRTKGRERNPPPCPLSLSQVV
jgi:enoyl-CoA hydratase/carnithine racemase